MKILIAHSFYRRPGGEDVYVRQQKELLEQTHDVEFFSQDNSALTSGPSALRRMATGSGVRADLRQEVERFKPDIIHLHNAYPSLGPVVHHVARDLAIPLVMTVHNFRLRCPNGYMFTQGVRCTRCVGGHYYNAALHGCFPSKSQAVAYASVLWLHRFLQRIEQVVSKFIAPSRFMYERMLEWGFAEDRVDVVHYCTNVPMAMHEPGDFGLYAGRLSSEKGLSHLLVALQRCNNPSFRIAGDGPDRQALERQAQDLGLTGVSFEGQVNRERLLELLTHSRYVVFPSVWEENFPVAAIEALAVGKPLVVADRGGLPELAAGNRGIVCAAGNSREMAVAITRLINDAQLCYRMGEAGLAFARSDLAPTGHLAQLEETYDQVLQATGSV